MPRLVRRAKGRGRRGLLTPVPAAVYVRASEPGSGGPDPWEEIPRCFRLRRTTRAAIPATSPDATTTPTPIPALAAGPIPPPPLSSCGTAATPLAVGATVNSAQCGPLPTNVQLCVTAQQPPPRLLGQAIWLVVQPAGIWDTSDGAAEVGLLVQMHWPALAHVWPNEQHPPPRDEAQPNMDVCVHCRGQHAEEVAVVAGVTVVTVTVMTHWYSDSEQGELQTEPMAQHSALEPVGSTMQYVSSGQHEAAPRGPMSLPGESQLYARRHVIADIILQVCSPAPHEAS